jgi:rod shape-determining protein MreB
MQYIKREYTSSIGERTAESIKIMIGTAASDEGERTIEGKGRDLVDGIPKIFTISSEEIRKACQGPVRIIIDAVRVALEQTPPELAADIVDRGIVLTGGGALYKNLDKLLREETGLPVIIAEDPLSTVARGAGKLLDDIDLLRDVTIPS